MLDATWKLDAEKSILWRLDRIAGMVGDVIIYDGETFERDGLRYAWAYNDCPNGVVVSTADAMKWLAAHGHDVPKEFS